MRFVPNRTRRCSPIGLDQGGRQLRAVQLSGGDGAWAVESSLTLTQPHAALDAARAAWLRDVLARRGFAGRRVVLSAPVPKLEAEILELPPRASGAPVEQIARAELASRARLTDGTFEMACWDVPPPPRGGTGTSLTAVALRHEDAVALLDPFETAGLEVVSIDARGWALARAIRPPAAVDEPFLVLDLEWDTGLVVLVHAGQVLFQRNTADVSFGAIHRAVAAEFGFDDELTDHVLSAPPEPATAADGGAAAQQSRLARVLSQYAVGVAAELEASLAFAAHRYPNVPVRRLRLCGEGARVTGFCEQLASRVGRDVELAAANLPGPYGRSLEATVGMAAIGLAMWRAGGWS
jgi:Tfp pilus assembly PilM family ATPase